MAKVAIDAMGGDHAPTEIVRGAVAANREFGIEVVLVGPPEILRVELDAAGADLPIVPAADVIGMDDHPTLARTRTNSSLVVGLRLVKQGEADAFLSAGNSGAVMLAALLQLGRIRGIERPAIGSVFATQGDRRAILIDAGANVSCKASHLVDFAFLGSAYLERVYGIERPTIGLISNGEEPSKGSPLVQEAHQLLAESELNFIGNVEGNRVVGHAADVLVTDGFTGNVMLKLGEGVADYIARELRAELKSRWYYALAGMIVKPAFRTVARRLDHAESGGAPLLGVNGAVLIAHGRADRRAIKNAVRSVAEMAREDVVGAVRQNLALRTPKGLRHGTS